MQPSTNRIMLAGVLCTLRLVAPAQGQAMASFQGLGELPDGVLSRATTISGDGRVVVGRSFSQESPAVFDGFRWTAETGMQLLARLEGAHTNSTPTRLSHDGSMIVGYSGVAAVRWIEDGQKVESLAPGEYSHSAARAVLANGTIVGDALVDTGQNTPRYYPFHWTSSEGMTLILDPIPPTPNPVDHISVGDASPDGSVMVGRVAGYYSPNFYVFPVRWTPSNGWELLGETGGGVLATNQDGSVLAGYTQVDSLRFAAMWDEQAGSWTQIDPNAEYANDVTPDGSIIVGGGGESCGDFAFIWDTAHGSRNLKSVLEGDYGLDLAGWSLSEAAAISDDGLTIVGYGCNVNGDDEAWLARLPDPCPADLDRDGSVGVADLLALLAAWDTNPVGPPDFDGDGVVSVPDLLGLLAAWGPCL